MLAKAGADILMPVTVGGVVGTAVDYAHYSFKQVTHDLEIQHYLLFYTYRKILIP